jgi:hypothetical protein
MNGMGWAIKLKTKAWEENNWKTSESWRKIQKGASYNRTWRAQKKLKVKHLDLL